MALPPAQDQQAPSEDAASSRSLAMMRRSAILMFLAGGASAVGGITMVLGDEGAKRAQLAVGVCLIVCGLSLMAVRRPPRWLLDACGLWGVLLVSTIVAVADPSGRGDFYYLWPIVYMAYFASRHMAVFTYGLMVVTLPLALLQHPSNPVKVDTFVGATVTVGLMGWLVTMMTARELNLSDRLRAAAATDPLTGLLNRRSFMPMMRSLVATSNASTHPLAFMIVDVDHFKRVNDTYGHGVGDHALQTLASVLNEQSRAEDVICRLGGEEFAVVLPGCSEVAAQAYIERVAAALATTPVVPGLTLSISAGICMASEADGDADALLERADQALYGAKQAGRRRFATWRPVIEIGPPLPNAGGSSELARSSDGMLATADRQSER